jgi:hypothetical protein
VAEQEGGQAEIARVKSLQRILEKGCSYKGAEFQFDLCKAKDNNRAKAWKLLLRLPAHELSCLHLSFGSFRACRVFAS